MYSSRRPTNPATPVDYRGIDPLEIDRLWRSVRNDLRRRGADAQTAEDITQDTWLIAIRRAPEETTGDVRGTVVRLFSPEGTLVVEVDDPNVSVSVDGEDVVITGAGAREIRLKPGQYKVKASRDGQTVSEELVRVERNGKQIVRVRREGGLPAEPRPAAGAAEWEQSVAGLPAEEPVAPVRIGGSIREPRKLKDVRPVYPPEAIQARVQGVVILECTISPTGKVVEAKPLRSIPLLTEAAVEAVKQWEYTPTELNGVPVPVIMTVTVNFKLS